MNVQIFLVIVFVLGYLAIALESYIKVSKTAVAVLMAVFSWMFLFLYRTDLNLDELIDLYLGGTAQIVFFLLGAMTLVELIDAHKGFKIITDVMNTRSKKKMLWLMGISTFFLSSILDNLTTTIVMVSLCKKIIKEPKDRLLLGASIVVAANAGGAWTAIGDVTTTMLWIKGHISSIAIMKALFIPSFVSLSVTLYLLGRSLKGEYPDIFQNEQSKVEPGAKIVLGLGILSLIFVPIFKGLTGLPPFMGIFLGLGVLWVLTDLMHFRHEERKHLRVPHILGKIDVAGVLFFLGILLCINTLEVSGILKTVAIDLGKRIDSLPIIATLIGLLSAIVDNVPLVAACMGMYDFPIDSSFWQMIAYTAGTGGSILVIGSAAGVAFMGLEKVDFLWYLKKVSLAVMSGYFVGIALYLLLSI
jgi:NhaD family Na+/H+ antiporter